MKRREFLKNITFFALGGLIMPSLIMEERAEAAWQVKEAWAGVKVKPTYLKFGALENREQTDAIVVHHIGNTDADVSAETVHSWHQNQGWSGIGYHYLIRKDGTIEQGRPRDTVGAHCYGENWHTVGINIVGNFEESQPMAAQMESAGRLLSALCINYGLVPGDDTIFGHRDFNDTACPGRNLYARMPELVQKARKFYFGRRP